MLMKYPMFQSVRKRMRVMIRNDHQDVAGAAILGEALMGGEGQARRCGKRNRSRLLDELAA